MSASAPINNLSDHVRKATNASSSLHPAQPKAAKFKPATSNSKSAISNSIPSNSLRKQASATLPSFSTPGFGKSKAAGSHSRPGFYEPISISSSSDSPSPGVKRTSSDSFTTEQPSAKRLKAEKENHFQPESVSRVIDKGKGKAKAVPPPSEVDDDDDEPWLKMETYESNPFTMLDRDYPEHRLSPAPTTHAAPAQPSYKYADSPVPSTRPAPAELTTKYPDLLTITTGHLNEMLISNLEHLLRTSDAALKDIYTLEAIKSLLTDRNAAIKGVLAHRKAPQGIPANGPRDPSVPLARHETPSYPDIRRPASPPPPVAAMTRSYEAYEATSYASTSTSVVREGSTVSTRDSTFVSVRERNETFASNPDEDDANLWDALDDVTMDDCLDAVPTAPAPLQPPLQDLTGPHAVEIKQHLSRTFGLATFRHNQFEAISAAMAGRDVFVLMPTGGGKSLCYQLPAVCRGGRTKGVTVVVSPLLALMHDQVNGMKAKNIDAVLLTSSTSEEESRQIRERIFSHSKPTLLYVTPERLKVSGSLKSMLGHLYRSRELARFVIDEAHCISTWGQDFREAYQELHTLRDEFAEVPIMALTATADRKTVDDIMLRLNLKNPAVFEQSFNRTNLFYSVVPKGSVDEMVNFIKGSHPNKTGVIYRTGRDKCEKLAQQLRQKGLKARHYHAKLEPQEKDEVLNEWKVGECHIIVATIAFGMGIDKADVRFVIHYDLPKNMDGYYQETGRAGRDGKPADCVLYYAYRDLQPILKMIRDNRDSNTTQASIERQELAVRAVVRYCENDSVCRRTQVLQHFGEKFDKKDCHGRCNNCANEGSMVTEDFTDEAKKALELVESLQRGQENVTFDHCRNIFKGANIAAVRDKGHDKHPLFGAGKDMPKEVVELLFNKLLYLDALIEQSTQTNSKWHTQYVKIGPKAKDLQTGRQVLRLNHRPKTPKPGGKAKARSRKPAPVPHPEPERQPDRPRSLYADDDDIEWSPKKSVRKPVVAEVVEVISDSEDETPSRPVPQSYPDPETLHQKLVAHRQGILNNDPSLAKEDVLDDETLEVLSVVAPQDFVAFKQSLQEVAKDKLGTLEKAKKDVDERYNKYGAGFLHLCQGRSADSNPTWREKYAHRPASASTAKSPDTQRKFKFVSKGGGL